MPHDEITELKILIAQVSGDVKSLESLIRDLRDSARDGKTQSDDNTKSLITQCERLKTAMEDLDRNFEQHRDFYKKINIIETKSDKMEGGILIIKWLLGFIGIAGIAATIKVFYK